MRTEQLQELENQGRRFAKALFEAGFDSQMVQDAAFAPSVRLNRTRAQQELYVNKMLSPHNMSAARLRAFSDENAQGNMFFAGVMAEVESRAADGTSTESGLPNGLTTITVNGASVQALSYGKDWLIRGTAQDRLTVAYTTFATWWGLDCDVENFLGGEHAGNPGAVQTALDYFWPGWRERNSGWLTL